MKIENLKAETKPFENVTVEKTIKTRETNEHDAVEQTITLDFSNVTKWKILFDIL